MAKDPRLLNIYLKIHNKRSLTMDDLQYLAIYSPECFEKTCKNVVYNIPKTKPIMAPAISNPQPIQWKKEPVCPQDIESVLENLKRLEANEFPIKDIDVNEVKNLLGNLYMELLYPHNDKDRFLDMPSNGNTSIFDKKV